MKISVLDKTKKKKILKCLEEFGVDSIPWLLIRSGKEKTRAYSGSLSKEEILDICKNIQVEGIGLYFGKEMIKKDGTREFRLSMDGLMLLKSKIKKKIIILTREQESSWFRGENIELTKDQSEKIKDLGGYFALRSCNGKDLIGIGKIGLDKKTVYSYLPKERRIKDNII